MRREKPFLLEDMSEQGLESLPFLLQFVRILRELSASP
jgi:hypothetical protein